MPLYEYKCEECGNEFEEIMSSSTEETPDCPVCNAENVVKMLSACKFDAGTDNSSSSGMDLPPMPPMGGGCGGGGGFS